MTLHTALNILLHKYTGQEDIVIGSPIAGREHPDLEGQIGFYINTLALRTQFSKEDTIESLYQKIKHNTLGAYSHQVYPYDELVDVLQLTRDMSRNPLFDVMLVLQSIEEGANNLDFSNATLQPYTVNESGYEVAKFDLDFLFYESGHSIIFSTTYNVDVYSEKQINQLYNSLINVLNIFSLNTSIPIKEIQILTPNELQCLTSFEDISYFEKEFNTVLDTFKKYVKIQPNQIALVFKDLELSYLELDKLSNKFSRYLKSKTTLRKGDLIVIELNRSHYTVVSVLSALKMGLIFVPIDNSYPEERKNFIIEDTGCNNIINEELFNDFFQNQDLYSDKQIEILIFNDDLIYCIYTSGSTGKPKGVIVEHKGVLNILEAWKKEYKITSNDCVLQIASFSFDVFIGDLCRSIFSGAKLVICPDEVKFSSIELINLVHKQKISLIEATPAFLIPLFEEIIDKQIKLPSLRCVIFGSDLLDINSFKKYTNQFSEILVVNSFGTTETTIDNSYFVINSENYEVESTTPIGKPFKNNYFILLNSDMQVIPYGSIGEICIGGVGLARGYLNREELTKEKFIENPYKLGERLYRTGDLGRWREDGNMEYLGRIDDQVKIRGYRIELGEIEQVLTSHTAVVQGVVIARSLSSSTDKELIAYATGEVTAEELKVYLKEKLPSYMVPNYYVKLDIIPLTSNGKVDRKALPDPEGTGIEFIYISPTTETEKQLVKIWSIVLGVEENSLSIKADFFDLGGNSLHAIRLITRIHRFFNIRLMISDLFLNSELESLGRMIESLNSSMKSNFEIEL
jgi:amino acid adenylation domain-containing protein